MAGCCRSAQGKVQAPSPVQFVVSGGSLDKPEVFDAALSPDALDLARTRAKETGGRVATSIAKRR